MHQERHGTSSCLRSKDIVPASSVGLLCPTGAGRGIQVSPHTRQPWRLDAWEIITDVTPLSAHSERSVSALSARNFLQSCLGWAPGPKFLVGDVHAACDNGPGRTLRGRLPWLISSSDNREVSPLYLLESWPGLGGGLEGEAQPHCRPSRPGHLGRKGSASESGELPRAFHSCPQHHQIFTELAPGAKPCSKCSGTSTHLIFPTNSTGLALMLFGSFDS